eukprot:NODE_2199_length_968_cov_61.571273_g1809_i0.p1 GENE.NODE_2199_length_968_cov_61.571273_g1809_i0~~NODE_2199_length_968_cov_61.571273_g1809_i0.p1  ORF type:complete len:293 (-),score=61.72 NODE_2199_length_968_cov_61.571273_g1809_i0:57-935(-)
MGDDEEDAALRDGVRKAGCTLPHQTSEQAHCWAVPPASNFDLRVGPDYRRNKQKRPSQPSICRVVAVDLFSCPRKLHHIAPDLHLDDTLFPPGSHLFIINCMLPNYSPSMWQTVWDGPGWSLVMYMIMSQETLQEVRVATSGHLGLLRRFMDAELSENPNAIYDRMKMIGKISNVEEVEFYSTEKSVVSKYNAKPVLTRPQHQIFHGENYTEVDVDVHTFSFIGRKGFHGFNGRLPTMVLDVAFVLEAETNEELPEVVLGCMRAFKVDLRKAVPWSECPLLSDPAIECAQDS